MSAHSMELPRNEESLEALGFSASWSPLLNIGIRSFGQLYEYFQKYSVSKLCFELFNDGQLRRSPTSPDSLIEIVIKLAFAGVNVSEKIDEYITELIKRDVKYSEVKFWIDMKKLLAAIAKEKPSIQEHTDDAEYDELYDSVVSFIMQRSSAFTVEEILPVEDDIELSCNICDYKTSTRLKDIFSISCAFCMARVLAPRFGFEALKITDIDDEEFVGDFDEYDIAFFCQLCATTSRENVLDPYCTDFTSRIRQLECQDCTGEAFLEWIADCNNYKVVFEEFTVEFQCDNRMTRKIRKADLSPKKIMEYILKGGNDT